MNPIKIPVLFFITILAACSSGSSGDADSADGSAQALGDAVGVCEARHASRSACGGEAATEADEELPVCKDKAAPCYASVMRPESIAALRACFQRQQCSVQEGTCRCAPIEDECFYDAGEAFRERPEVKAFTDRCLAKHRTCAEADASGTFVDDYCDVAMFNDATRRAMDPCLDLACGGETIGLCFEQAVLEASKGVCSETYD